MDLFTVTLRFGEQRYALTKDQSKFYQRAKADEITQHMRQVMWRDCDKIYVTTTVIMDRPAGCIAIAAMRETAERCGKDLLKAFKFLKYRTYVDNMLTGASSMEQ